MFHGIIVIVDEGDSMTVDLPSDNGGFQLLIRILLICYSGVPTDFH